MFQEVFGPRIPKFVMDSKFANSSAVGLRPPDLAIEKPQHEPHADDVVRSVGVFESHCILFKQIVVDVVDDEFLAVVPSRSGPEPRSEHLPAEHVFRGGIEDEDAKFKFLVDDIVGADALEIREGFVALEHASDTWELDVEEEGVDNKDPQEGDAEGEESFGEQPADEQQTPEPAPSSPRLVAAAALDEYPEVNKIVVSHSLVSSAMNGKLFGRIQGYGGSQGKYVSVFCGKHGRGKCNIWLANKNIDPGHVKLHGLKWPTHAYISGHDDCDLLCVAHLDAVCRIETDVGMTPRKPKPYIQIKARFSNFFLACAFGVLGVL